MKLVAAGVNHTTADVTLRERLAVAPDHTEEALADLKALPGVAEAALLSTCNRMELYCLCEQEVDLSRWLADWHRLPEAQIKPALYVHREEGAMRHMMRVAAGLDSKVLGEPQILGQMHSAYRLARDTGAIHKHLEQVFQQVFSVAKRVRSDTGIGKNPVSVASAAVAFARHIFSELESSQVLLVGAGEMIGLVARHLREQGVTRITIANRSLSHAATLAGEVAGKVLGLDRLVEGLAQADIVISCTGSPQPLVTLPLVTDALKGRRHRPIFMVDLAVPRDIAVEVGGLSDVYLYTIDQLHTVIDANLTERQQAAAEGQQLIEMALDDWQRKQRENRAVDTLKLYRQSVETLSQQELERAMQQLEAGQDAAEVLSRFRHALANKLMHHPSVMLRRFAADERLLELGVARELLLAPEDDATDGGA